jgi:hypothetical protein
LVAQSSVFAAEPSPAPSASASPRGHPGHRIKAPGACSKAGSNNRLENKSG